MIKPSDLTPLAPQPSPILAAIEQHIDRAITRHATAGHPWPLVIPTMRSGWSEADISAVLARYRAAGWSAMSGGRRALCVMSPLETATANQADEALQRALAEHNTATTDPLLGFTPDEIVVGPGGQTLTQSATIESAVTRALAVLGRPQHPEHVAQAKALLTAHSSLEDLIAGWRVSGHVGEVWAIAGLAWHIAQGA